jgi:urate oxidase
MARLEWNRYGKASVRLVRVHRARDPHTIRDMTVKVQLEGDFETVYVGGDNTTCVATDTMKNTVYALAGQGTIDEIERFADRLASLFVEQPHVSSARVSIVEHRWDRIESSGMAYPHAFVQPGGERWTARVVRDRVGARVTAGLDNLVVLKTTDSGFAGFPRDQYTTLKETLDRILATAVKARWRYAQGEIDYGVRERVRTALVETFAGHDSRSVQHTLYAMAEAALSACEEVERITLTLPNRHHLLVDLSPFGLDNPNEVFVATNQPYGLIEATVGRG